MLELVQEQAEGVLTQLHDIAHTHAAASDGMFVGLDRDPTLYPGQDILKGVITGKPLPPAEANQLAIGVDPRYEALYEATASTEELKAIGETLRSGQNAVLATDHRELIDIALQLLAASSLLRGKGIKFRSGIVVSRMVDFLGVQMFGSIVPARDLLGFAFDRTYMTIPSTISTKNRIGRSAKEKYNDFVTDALEGDVNRRPRSNRVPMLLGVAMPGTIDKALDTTLYIGKDIPPEIREKTIVVGRISYETIKFMKYALAYATVTKMNGLSADVRVDPLHINVRTSKDVDQLAQKLITLLNDRDPDVNYVYDRDGNLPVLVPSAG